MDALKAVSLCALLAAPPQAAQPCGPVMAISSPKVDRWQPLIAAASVRFGIPADWIRAVMARESAGLTALHGAPIVSSAGAMGLMQLMHGTWSEMRARYGFGNDPFDPHDNIFAGTAYLREMFDRYGYPGLFAAYHAGPGRLDATLAGLKPLPEATETYLESIVPAVETGAISSGNRLSTIPKSNADSLFFVRESDGNSSPEDANSLPDDANSSRAAPSLFVPLSSQPISPRS
jgi:soluble lytic murein transglycosylase-like protein